MSDAVKQEDTKQAVDPTKYVPKETVDQLQADLEKTKLELLSPEYIEFLNAKKNPTKTEAKVTSLMGELTPQEIESLPKAKLLELAIHRAEEKLTPAIRAEFDAKYNALSSYVGNIGAYLEVEQARKKYPDFDDLRGEIDKVLSTAKRDVTFEEAYLQIKGAKSLKEPEAKSEEKPKAKSSEKPGGVTPPEGSTERKFKSDLDAGMAAWEETKTKHGITGDII